MDEPCSRETLRACLRDLARVNRWLLGYRPTLTWLDEVVAARRAAEQEAGLGSSPERPLRILDVGCGYGDGLRRIAAWARQVGVAVELTGIDLNLETCAIAREASASEPQIAWVCADVFSYAPAEPPDVIVSALFTHHLGDQAVVRFVRWMEQIALLGWFINDLSRAPVPYHLFRWFSAIAGLHPFVRHDGPVSIARAFQPQDWRRLCAEAGLSEGAVGIRGFTPGRLCVSRSRTA